MVGISILFLNKGNMMKYFIRKTSLRLCAALAISVSLSATANVQGGIVFNPVTGSYTITYESDGGLSETIYIPASSSLAPTVQSAIRLMENKAVVYRYAVANGATAKQSIRAVYFDGVPNLLLGEIKPVSLVNDTVAAVDARFAAMNRAMATPPKWDNRIDRDDGNNIFQESRIIWLSDDTKGNLGIAPGNKVGGFGFSSMDLPGILNAKLEGQGSGIVYADEGPADGDTITKQIDQLRDNDFIAEPAAVPVIAVPVPFDAAVLLDRIRTHVATWPSKQLLDSAFATQLDRTMAAAANAFRINQPKAGREILDMLCASCLSMNTNTWITMKKITRTPLNTKPQLV